MNFQYIHYLLIGFIFWSSYTNADQNPLANNPKYDRYVQDKLKFLRDELSESFARNRRENPNIESTTIKFNKMEPIISNLSSPNFHMQVIDNSIVFINNYTKSDIFTENQILEVPFDQILSNNPTQQILFLRGIEFKNRYFLLVALANGICKIYSLNFREGTNLVWKLNQIIPNVHVASDAKFFLFQGHLYLFVLNYNGASIVPSILYQWMDSYFDEISKRILTVGAIGLSISITENGATFLILQNIEIKSKQTSLVLNFDGENIQLIHHLNLQKPTEAHAYTIFNSNFMIVSSKDSGKIVYRIKDIELMEWFHVEMNQTKGGVKLFKANQMQFGIVINQDKLDFYALDTNKIKKLSEFVLENSEIVDFEVVENSGLYTLILVTKTNNHWNIQKSKFKISMKESANLAKPCEKLLEKLENIYSSLEQRKPKLQLLANFKSDVKTVSVPRESATAVVQPSNLVLDESSPNTEKMQEIKEKLRSSLAKYDKLNNAFATVFRSDIPQNITGNIMVNGNVVIENMSTNQLRVETINSKPWVPQNWLTQGLTQTISGFVRAKKITSNVMDIPNWNKLSDIILLQGNQEFHKPLTIKTMFAQNIQTEEINSIPVRKVVVAKSGIPIEGVKTFQQLSAKNLNVINWNKLNLEKPLVNQDFNTFSSDVKAINITTETINGIDWNQFISSLYLKGFNKKISGNILFNDSITIGDNFNVEHINDFPVSQFLTKTTDQIISTSLQLRSIKVTHMDCKNINNISLSNQAAILGVDNLILGPVSAFNIKVNKDLTLRGNHSNFFQFGNHTLGTRSSDLLQVYTSPVTIHGNVFMKNIGFKMDSNVFIAEKMYESNFHEKYWLKSIDQIIKEDVTIEGSMSVSDAVVKQLNGFDFQFYATNDFESFSWPLKRSIFYFKYCQVLGNVSFDRFAIFDPIDPRSIVVSAIRKDQEAYRISGPKFFTQPIIVDNLLVDQMNNVTMDEINLSNHKKIIIHNDLVLNPKADLNVGKIITSDSHLKFAPTINSKSITASNLNVDMLNGFKMNHILEFLQNQLELNRLVITNDVYFPQMNAKFINNFPTKHLAQIVQKAPHIKVYGSKTFTQNVQINGNFNSEQINDVQLPYLLEYGLSRSKTQTIHGYYKFDSIKSASITANLINGIDFSSCLYRNSPNPQTIYIPNIEIQSLDVKGSIFANTFNNHPTLRLDSTQSLIELVPLNLASVTVKGDVIIPDNSFLENLLQNAVYSGMENIITGEVYFTEGIIVENITCNNFINDVDISEIISDALLKNENNQVISGCNTFNEPLYSNGVTSIGGDFVVKVVNGVDIEEFDRSYVRKGQSHAVKGHKTFHKGFSANYLKLPAVSWNGNGGGIRPEVLCTYDSEQHFPASIFTNLSISNDLYIENLNQVKFAQFLQDRISYSSAETQHVWGKFYFDQINIEGMSHINSINHLYLNDFVTDEGFQVINTKLDFSKNIFVAGKVQIEQLNNFDVKTSFQDAIFIDEDAIITNNVYFSKEANIKNLSAEYLNGIPVKQMSNYLKSTVDSSRPVFQKVNYTENLITTGLSLTKDYSLPLLYVEPFEDIDIPVSNTRILEKVSFGNQTFVSLIGETSGEKCGLSAGCTCPVQYTMQMRLHEDVQFLHGNDYERVFTFRDDKTGIVVNVATNTVSKSSECQKLDGGSDVEVTNINWILSTTPKNEVKPGIFIDISHITGYLSDVKFFTNQGSSYLILARYYDAIADSYELNCLLLELRDSNAAVLIQEIPCVGVSKLELLETYHGTILATTNREENQIQTDSAIYKFDEDEKNFLLLRTVSNSDISDICGINTDDGSFLVFAHRKSPLDIYKYNHEFENYYYYQSLVFDSSVSTVYPFYTFRNDRFDSYLCVALTENVFYIYEYEFIEGFQMKTFGELENIQALIPYEFGDKIYLFAPANKYARIFSVVRQGVN